MVALKTSARKEANRFIEDVFSSGIRFVLFNEESQLHTKIIGDDLGLDIDWNSCISLSSNSAFSAFINSMGMRVLPSGIEEIAQHLAAKVDDVPLLVSMFSDSTPESILEMVKLYQLHGEVVAVVGGTLNSRNMAAYEAADVAVGLGIQPCCFCENCSGQRIDYQYRRTISEEIAQMVVSAPCAFTLNANASLYRILQVVKEARKLMRNMQLALVFSISCYLELTAAAAVSFALGWPPLLSTGQYSFVVYGVVPLLTVGFLGKQSSNELMKLLPIKMLHFSITESGWFLRNHLLRIAMSTLGFLGSQGFAIRLYSAELLLGFAWQRRWTEEEEEALRLVQLVWACVWMLGMTPGYLAGFESVDFSVCSNHKWLGSTLVTTLATAAAVGGYLSHCTSAMGLLLREIWPLAIVWCFWFSAYQVLDHFLKRQEKQQYQRLQKTMRLYFQTKLGMHSPK
jgi:magnesium-transporting ATPase (P-type)